MSASELRYRVALKVIAAATLLLMQGCRGGSDVRGPGDEPRNARATSSPKGIVRLTETQMREFGVQTAPAAHGTIQIRLTLPGEVALNADRVGHVVPRVSGVVREVRKNLGDNVRRGEIMAVLESRDLADSTAQALAARERVVLAQSNFAREEQLWQKRISPEQDYIQAKNSLAEARIELRKAEQKLRALGFNEDYITQLASRTADHNSMIYEIPAPFDATVIEKHISLGEVVKDDTAAFLIADLSTVWVNLDVHQKDLALVKVGQGVTIGIGNEMGSVEGRIAFLDPMATETNRTIHARVVVPNREGKLRPGLFVNGRITVDNANASVVVPNDTVVLVDGTTCVFVREGDGFRVQPVSVARTDGVGSEISAGLAPGQVYATKGAFTLKSELQKPEAEK